MKTLKAAAPLMLGITLALISACSETKAEQQVVAEAARPDDARAQLRKDAQAALATVVPNGDTRPALSRDTVLRLNPIVARSKTALDRFDQLSLQLAAAQEAGDKAQSAAIIAEFGRLKAETEAAHVAFQAEKAALLKRDEYYDKVVLAAMEQFVAEAPGEIADALAAAKQ